MTSDTSMKLRLTYAAQRRHMKSRNLGLSTDTHSHKNSKEFIEKIPCKIHIFPGEQKTNPRVHSVFLVAHTTIHHSDL